ncbi:hypothetical protein D9M71_816220 [compost metagenome]
MHAQDVDNRRQPLRGGLLRNVVNNCPVARESLAPGERRFCRSGLSREAGNADATDQSAIAGDPGVGVFIGLAA